MFPYWVLFSMFAAGALQNGRRTSSVSPLFGFAVAAMVLLVGLRYQVGPDWLPYVDLFQQMRHIDFAVALKLSDPGFAALNWVAHRLGVGFWWVNLVCATVLGCGLLRFAKCQPSPWLAMLIAIPYLVIVIGMSATRQATAVGFILLALPAFSRRAWPQFWFWSILATSFHATAFLVVLLAGLALSRNALQKLVVGASTLFFGFLLLSPALDTLVNRYADADIQSQGAAIRVLMNVVPALLYMKFAKRFSIQDHEHRFWRNLSLVALISVPLLFLMSSSTVIDRLVIYLVPLQIFTFSRIVAVTKPSIRREALLGLVAYCALVQAVWLIFSVHGEFWVPYKFYPFAR